MHSSSKKVYLIGLNNDTLEVASVAKKIGIKVEAIINDYFEEDFFEGIPVIRTDQANLQYAVINCSSSISPLKTQKHFTSIGFNVQYFAEFMVQCTGKFPQRFLKFSSELEKIQNLYTELSDEISKKHFSSVTGFRSFGDLEYMADFEVNIKNQYLDMAKKLDPSSFMDVGGFDGDTSELLLSNLNGLTRIELFEPNKTNIENAKIRLQNHDCVNYHMYGLGNKNFVTRMSDDGSSSQVNDEGELEIKIKRLDDIDIEAVDFIKIDIEGAELSFLKGARGFLKETKPNLAIASYHFVDDLITIPNFVRNEIFCDYELYFRHYTQGWSESILYFVPAR